MRKLPTLPTLEQLRVASPCKVPWEGMPGNERVRRCDRCKQNVFNLSAMTRAEAEAVIAEHDAEMCMRYYHRGDGTMLLRDCAVEYRPTGLLVIAAAGALALAGAALYAHAAAEPPVERMLDAPTAAAPTPPPAMIEPPPPDFTMPSPPAVTITPKKARPTRPPTPPIHVTGGIPPRRLPILGK